jgi:hypothetical protein
MPLYRRRRLQAQPPSACAGSLGVRLVRGLALALALATPAAVFARDEEPVRLPALRVSDDMDHWRFPVQELARLATELEKGSPAMKVRGLQVRPTRNSRCEIPPRIVLRDDRGRATSGQSLGDYLPADPWPTIGFVSSNQPREFAEIYLVVATTPAPGDVRVGDLLGMLSSYGKFADEQIRLAAEHHGARSIDEFADAAKITRPDALVILAASAEAAHRISARMQVEPDDLRITLTREHIEWLAKSTPDLLVAMAGEVRELTPWRTAEPNPPVFDHGGALYLIGWFSYRPSLFASPRQERMTLGLTTL